MKSQWLLLAITSRFFSITYAQTTNAPAAATTSKSDLDSILGVGLSFVRSIVAADPTTVTTTFSPTSISSSSTTPSSTSSTSSSTSSRPTSSSTTLASQTSSSFSSSSSARVSLTSTTPSAATSSAEQNEKGDPSNRNLAIILGSVLGSLALLSLIIFFCCLRRHRKKHPHDHIGYDHIGYDHLEKIASSSRQSLAGKGNSSAGLTANSRSRSLSDTRSVNQDYSAIPPVPPPHRLSRNDSSPYGVQSMSQQNSRHDPFHDRNVSTPGRYYDPHAPPAHRTPPLPKRSPQRQSDYFPPYDAPRRSQESSPHSSFGSGKTLSDSNHANGVVVPSPPLQTQQKHRSLPRSSLANEFNFGFDGRDGGSGGYGQDIPREFRRKSVISR